MIVNIMKIFKNLFGDGSKIHADEIIVGNKDNNEILSEVLRQGVSITPAPQSNWTGTLYVSKNGLDQVHMRGSLRPGILTTRTIILTLPLGFRPSYRVAILYYDSNRGLNYRNLMLDIDGSLIIRNFPNEEIRADGIVNINILFQI